MSSPAVPEWTGVALSVSLVAVAVVIAWRQHLGLAREIVVAAVRAGVQLLAVGAGPGCTAPVMWRPPRWPSRRR